MTLSLLAQLQAQQDLAQQNYEKVAAQKALEDAKVAARAAEEAKAMTSVLEYLRVLIQDHLNSGKPFSLLAKAYLEHPAIAEDSVTETIMLVFDLLAHPVLGLRQGANGLSWNLQSYDSVKALFTAVLDHLGIPNPVESDRWFGRLLVYLASADEGSRGMGAYEAQGYLRFEPLPEANTVAATTYLSRYGLGSW